MTGENQRKKTQMKQISQQMINPDDQFKLFDLRIVAIAFALFPRRLVHAWCTVHPVKIVGIPQGKPFVHEPPVYGEPPVIAFGSLAPAENLAYPGQVPALTTNTGVVAGVLALHVTIHGTDGSV